VEGEQLKSAVLRLPAVLFRPKACGHRYNASLPIACCKRFWAGTAHFACATAQGGCIHIMPHIYRYNSLGFFGNGAFHGILIRIETHRVRIHSTGFAPT
jgi:hypothetical protein